MIYDVIIIGAGISGVGASTVLSKAKVPHLILQSRDRIGGRIASQSFDGIMIDAGASYVHHPNNKNQIHRLIKQLKWPTKPAQFSNQIYLKAGSGQLNKKSVFKAERLYEQMIEYMEEAAEKSMKDLSIAEATEDYFEKCISLQSQEVRNAVRWMLEIHGNVDGAELKEMSAKEFCNDESEHDVLPQGGYAKLLNTIFDISQPQVRLCQKVCEIDYSSDLVVVITEKNVFRAKKVISSLPLGILQRRLVKFVPELPLGHTKAIENMGNGVANKLIVSFATPFWPIKKTWINFVSAKQSRYPVALNMSEGEKYILCLFVSGDASKQISGLSNEEITEDLVKFLQIYFPKEEIKVRETLVTRWQEDVHSMGSYSYFKVGTTTQDVQTIKEVINGKIWFIGEHCHPQMNGCAHSAFETGLWAAKQAIALLGSQNEA